LTLEEIKGQRTLLGVEGVQYIRLVNNLKKKKVRSTDILNIVQNIITSRGSLNQVFTPWQFFMMTLK